MKKGFFFKEVKPPDTQEREYILRKLAALKKVPNSTNKTTLVQMLRRRLRSTEGAVTYYRYQKGLKIRVGDDKTPKKHFLLSKDGQFLQPQVREHRAKLSAPPVRTRKKRYVGAGLDLGFEYFTIGGVMEKPDYFKDQAHVIKRKRVTVAKYPKTPDPYIGIEIEYASKLTIDEIVDIIVKHNLQDQVRVMRDGSIRTNEIYPHQVEFCILTKWSELGAMLQKLRPIIFDKPQHFAPNSSCGLHVHLDMRHDNATKVFANLTAMQSVLFNIVNENRRDNRYCRPVHTTDFDDIDTDSDDAHYDAISKFSYIKHETIEVRIHHSTLDLTQVEKWITLLKRIADYRGEALKIGTFESEFKQLCEKVQIDPELVKYVEARKAL